MYAIGPQRVLMYALCLVSLSGCTSIQSHVQSFSAPDGITKNDQIFIAWLPSNRHQELEGQSWVSLAKSEVEKKGYKVAETVQSSSVLLFVALDIDNGNTQAYSYNIPHYGIVGYSGSTTMGTANTFGNMTSYNATTNYTPQYGVTGYSSGVGYNTVYRRTGALIAFRPTAGGKPRLIYNTHLVSSGGCGVLPAISPFLIKAMFSGFPNAGTDVVNLPARTKC